MLAGFGNHHQTEALSGALPSQQNSPQQCAYDLFAEQFNGSAFTRPRHLQLKTWLYRKKPQAGAYINIKPYSKSITQPFSTYQPPEPWRFSPMLPPEQTQDWIDGLWHVAGNRLCQTYLYHCTKSMGNRFTQNRDGEWLFVPYQGQLCLHTEMGLLHLKPGMIAVIPRGIIFKIEVTDGPAAGYLCENLKSPLTLPELGPIGANGLANPRHFLYPEAAYDTESQPPFELICKYHGQWWQGHLKHNPLDVFAWQGNYAPYTYDLSLFNTLGSVSFDHPDPSIFTVLTSVSNSPGVANLDLVIFPERWMVAEHTFRPPYFHRNIMSEWMGLIQGVYDAKSSEFAIGGISIHNQMTGHGPDTSTYQTAMKQTLQPSYYANTLAFMFESRQPWLISEQAYQHPSRQRDYSQCWDF